MECQPAKVYVKAMKLDGYVGVCVERYGWTKCFKVKIANGRLPPGFEGDPEILAAYKEVQVQTEKWQRMQNTHTIANNHLENC